MKKGDVTMTAIVGIILVIAAFLIIMTVITLLYSKIPDKDVQTSCRASNVLRGQTKIGTSLGPVKIEQSGTPSACKTFDKEISGYKGTVMLQMADYAADCWWQWANGNWDGLLCDQKGVEPIASCDDSNCFACYIVYIDSLKDRDTGQPTTFTATDFRDFMRHAKKYYENTETGEVSQQGDENSKPLTYLDYIQYDERGVLFFTKNFDLENEFVFEAGKYYAIYYFEPHETDFYKEWLGSGDNRADELKGKRAIFIEEQETRLSESGTCKVKYGLEGK